MKKNHFILFCLSSILSMSVNANITSNDNEKVNLYMSVLPGYLEEVWDEDRSVLACREAGAKGDIIALESLYNIERSIALPLKLQEKSTKIIENSIPGDGSYMKIERLYRSKEFRSIFEFKNKFQTSVKYCESLASK